MCLYVNKVVSPVRITQNQLVDHVKQIATKPIICYKRLRPNGIRNQGTSYGDFVWHKGKSSKSALSYAGFACNKVSKYGERSRYEASLEVEEGLHAFLKVEDCKKSGYQGVIRKMMIPAGAKFILGHQGNLPQIVSTEMIFVENYIVKKKK